MIKDFTSRSLHIRHPITITVIPEWADDDIRYQVFVNEGFIQYCYSWPDCLQIRQNYKNMGYQTFFVEG